MPRNVEDELRLARHGLNTAWLNLHRVNADCRRRRRDAMEYLAESTRRYREAREPLARQTGPVLEAPSAPSMPAARADPPRASPRPEAQT